MLENPVGRRALTQIMITPETVRDHPELRRSFDAYISADGHRARIDLTQADRIYSAAAMDQVETLRRRTSEFLGDFESFPCNGPDFGRECRVDRYPSPHPLGPGAELVHCTDWCFPGSYPDTP